MTLKKNFLSNILNFLDNSSKKGSICLLKKKIKQNHSIHKAKSSRSMLSQLFKSLELNPIKVFLISPKPNPNPTPFAEESHPKNPPSSSIYSNLHNITKATQKMLSKR